MTEAVERNEAIDPWNLDAIRCTPEDLDKLRARKAAGAKRMRAIYLAGKIGASDWRHTVVPNLRGALTDNDVHFGVPWQALDCQVLDAFSYAGPFFASCDHACGHGGGQHGITETCGEYRTEKIAEYVLLQCFAAIRRCDIFFAWLGGETAATAHGTLVELGYAKALGKETIIAAPAQPINAGYPPHEGSSEGQAVDDLWFAFQTASLVMIEDDPVLALKRLAEHERGENAPTESPIEDAFWWAHRKLQLPELAGLVVQHPVLGGKYRLDFALPDLKIGVELDGYQYHGTSRDKFIADQQRQRALEAEGWRLIRFAGAEVHADAESCVHQAAQHVRALKNGGGR